MSVVVRDHTAPNGPSSDCIRCGLPKTWHAGPVNRAAYWLYRRLSRL